MTESDIKSGVRVRLIGNPERAGVISAEPFRRDVNGILMVRVLFDGSHVATWHRAANLERQPTHADPLDDLVKGRIQGLASFQRILTHEKLTGRLANVIYSMETSQTEFLPYQFKPVLKLLESPTNSLLIADEVGFGKTIEAGLIWTEFRARSGAQNLAGHLPTASARQVGHAELKNRFGVKAEICGAKNFSTTSAQLHQDPNHSFAIVCLVPRPPPPIKLARASPEQEPPHRRCPSPIRTVCEFNPN